MSRKSPRGRPESEAFDSGSSLSVLAAVASRELRQLGKKSRPTTKKVKSHRVRAYQWTEKTEDGKLKIRKCFFNATCDDNPATPIFEAKISVNDCVLSAIGRQRAVEELGFPVYNKAVNGEDLDFDSTFEPGIGSAEGEALVNADAVELLYNDDVLQPQDQPLSGGVTLYMPRIGNKTTFRRTNTRVVLPKTFVAEKVEAAIRMETMSDTGIWQPCKAVGTFQRLEEEPVEKVPPARPNNAFPQLGSTWSNDTRFPPRPTPKEDLPDVEDLEYEEGRRQIKNAQNRNFNRNEKDRKYALQLSLTAYKMAFLDLFARIEEFGQTGVLQVPGIYQFPTYDDAVEAVRAREGEHEEQKYRRSQK